MKPTIGLRSISFYLGITAAALVLSGGGLLSAQAPPAAQDATANDGGETASDALFVHMQDAPLVELQLAEMIDRAMQHNPEILVAQAQLRSAEAELNRMRLAITKDLIHLHQSLDRQRQLNDLTRERLESIEARLEQVTVLFQSGTVPSAEVLQTELAVQENKAALVDGEAALAELEAQLPYILGSRRQAYSIFLRDGRHLGYEMIWKYIDNTAMEQNEQAAMQQEAMAQAAMERATAQQNLNLANSITDSAPADSAEVKFLYGFTNTVPADSAEAKLRAALGSPTDIEVVEVPLDDLLEFLTDLHGVKFLVSEKAFQGVQAEANEPITLRMSGVPLAAALQAIEDKLVFVRFFVRDYGILVLPRDFVPGADADEMVPVHDFWKGRSTRVRR